MGFKKTAAVIAAISCCFGTFANISVQMKSSENASAAGTVSAGDVTLDGNINIFDLCSAKYGVKNGFSSNDAKKAADVNGDGTADAADIKMISDYIHGKISEFPNVDVPTEIKDYGTPMNENATMVSDFRKGETPLFFASDGWTNGNPFDCGWTKNNANVADGYLTLTIDKDSTGKYNYTGGEYRTADHYSYGYYETSMQAIKNDGVVSSFFTYTGPSEDNPWDEIDIEVLGKDTTKVQFNYYTNGVGNHEYMYDLGFDASEGFHTYGFDWQPDHITWYVDGKAVYTATSNIPSTPSRIMMNVWPGTGVNEWLAPFNGNTPLNARYQWVTYNKSESSSDNPGEDNPSTEIKDYGTPMNENATMVSDFRKGETPLFFASDGWTNGNPFDCGWTKNNAKIADGYLTLTIDKDSTGKYNYTGGEYRTADHYSYGYYETSMQAIKNDGVVSSFFTYTGPSESNPWDEIDIEVLGKDTTKVQFNYYTNGVGNHEYMYDLGFDASEGFHTYGFDWQPDHITWYVDGKAVYTATSNIPSTPGRIMMNVWPGTGVNEWLAPFNGNTPLNARYQWVTYNKSESSSDNPGEDNPSNEIKDYGTPMNSNATAVADFRKGETPLFFASDGWTNGNPFDCGWTKNNAKIADGYLTLTIDKDSTGKYNYTGGEYRTADHYSYGYYETSMQAIKNDGVVSSFFTYTGPSEDNPWDEIDIEVLGKDTTKVQFNYYTNGVGNHEYMYDLGFDASEGFHTYGFDWQPDHITWYVDGKAVYTATSNIPSTPGRIMMNVWPGTGVDGWLKAYDGTTPLNARYQWVTFNNK